MTILAVAAILDFRSAEK